MKQPLTRILYAEDEPDIQVVAQLALEMVGGFTVEICNNGREALEKAPEFAPQLILLDMMMPEMDGVTTLSNIRATPALASIPVVFMTAKAQPSEVAHYKELGAADVISKPFDPMTLANTIRTLWETLP
jgi:two-component system OmpR family response regulator